MIQLKKWYVLPLICVVAIYNSYQFGTHATDPNNFISVWCGVMSMALGAIGVIAGVAAFVKWYESEGDLE